MIDCEQLFLFEKIPQGSKVVIYGMGRWGISYLRQIQVTNYCEVVAYTDREKKNLAGYIPYASLDELKELDYDYIVIALFDSHTIEEIYNLLIDIGIEEKKIVSLNNRRINTVKSVNGAKGKKTISIALISEGGIGDCIVHSSIVNKINDIEPYSEITVFCNLSFGEKIFYKNRIKGLKDLKSDPDDNYDLVLQARNSLSVLWMNENVVKKSSGLYRMVEELLADKENFELGSTMKCKDAVLLRRAELLHQNRFSFLDSAKLNISPSDISIVMNEAFKDKYDSLGLKKYITVNIGADRFNKEKDQTKVWAREKYNSFVAMFKTRYPDIDIVQIGTADAYKIEGVDKRVLGEDLFLVEYVLKNALFHFDCEGGMVHLATALGTKCIVLFGPTPEFFYGYEKNINIVSSVCKNCMGTTEEWMFNCIRGYDKPICMESIKPESVLKKAEEYLEECNIV